MEGEVSWMFQGCFMVVKGISCYSRSSHDYQECYQSVSRKFQENVQGVSKKVSCCIALIAASRAEEGLVVK